MILRHHRRGLLSPLALAIALYFTSTATTNALSIRREPVTEQVLIITTPDPLLQDETQTPAQDEEDRATTVGLDLELEQRDEPARTTVDTLTIAGNSGESWEVDPTASSIVSKDVEIEIKDGTNTNSVHKLQSESGQEGEVDPSKPILPEIYSFHIQSDVKYRYSRTYVTSRVANKDATRAHEVTFSVVLPETAFISKFLMEIDGKSYEAYVKEKEEAKKDYQQAQSQGQSAGLVEKSTRNSNVFNVNVNIKPQTKVTFNLTYEELLTRRLGRYEQAININPDQVSSIKDYQIVVNIEESRNLTFVRVPSLSNDIEAQDPSGNNQDAVIERPAPNKAKISWSPTTADQKKLVKEGISGKFIVQYDVDREAEGGQILVMQGYFVHFFAPENLPPLRKHVVFILDISGSMWGRKMEQLKESQKKILDDLTSDDYFNIITFSSEVYLWSPTDSLVKRNEFRQPSYSEITPPELLAKKQPLLATPENIVKAKAFIDSLVASGGTNIHDAIIEALNLTAVIKEAQYKASNPSTEANLIDTTILPSVAYSASTTTTAGTSTSPKSAPTSSSTSTTTTSSTTSTEAAPSSSSTVTPEEEEENTSIIIVDIAKSETIDVSTDKPEEVSATTINSLAPGQTVLPPNVQSLIIFLTDGEPTVGITDPPEIQKLIQSANRNLSIPIFSLGFGEGADFPFLKKLSLQNNGFGRKIYEASDAALQLKGFYNEIASPLLSNVTFNYTSEEYNVTDITVTRFPTVFGGTEIAVAGKLVAPPKPERADEDAETTISPSNDAQQTTETFVDDETPRMDFDAPIEPERLSISCDFELSDRFYLDVSIEGNGRDGEVDLHDVEFYDRRKCGVGFDFPIPFIPPSIYPPRPTPPPSPEDQFLERLWAYLTIQQLLEQDLAQGDSNSGDASENSDSNDIAPSSTAAPDDSTFITKVLPVQAPTTPTPSRSNSTKVETPKERALRLALKYGFVTPLTSLVVVKPNSSDVTNTVPTDGRPDAYDNALVIAPKRLSFTSPILAAAPHNTRLRSGPAARYHVRGLSYSPPTNSASHSYRIGSSSVGRAGTSSARSYSRNRHVDSFPRSERMRSSHHAPQSLSSAYAVPSLLSIRNKIASHPLPMPIHSNYQTKTQPALPIPFGIGGGPSSQMSLNKGPPPLFSQGNVDYSSIGESAEDQGPILPSAPVLILSIPSTTQAHYTTTARAPAATSESSSSAPLTLKDILWLKETTEILRLNETNYKIARQDTNEDNAGYDCTIPSTGDQGRCSHLKDCVLPAFTNDQELYKTSYFCSIQSRYSATSFVGSCCPTRRSRSVFEEP